MLKQLAETDHLLANRQPVPDNYICEYPGKSRWGVAHISELDNPGIQLVECIYQAIEADLAKRAEAQNLRVEDFKIPKNPLVVREATVMRYSVLRA